ncbi:hypothetical protein DFH29DRAFT_1001287 [Suillus ampliporus]|nr:hypothetical protein DFH29DRAFT_1001287 [Suillus ampliporus]
MTAYDLIHIDLVLLVDLRVSRLDLVYLVSLETFPYRSPSQPPFFKTRSPLPGVSWAFDRLHYDLVHIELLIDLRFSRLYSTDLTLFYRLLEDSTVSDRLLRYLRAPSTDGPLKFGFALEARSTRALPSIELQWYLFESTGFFGPAYDSL